jgi:hypothetical protein
MGFTVFCRSDEKVQSTAKNTLKGHIKFKEKFFGCSPNKQVKTLKSKFLINPNSPYTNFQNSCTINVQNNLSLLFEIGATSVSFYLLISAQRP